MRYRFLLILLLVSYRLLGRAAPALPDSVLTLEKAYEYGLVNMQYSLDILDAMRRDQKDVAWKIDLAEGDIYCMNRLLQRALKYYHAAIDNTLIHASSIYQMSIMVRMLFCYESCSRDKEVARIHYQLSQKARKSNDSFFLAIANFFKGKRAHYHGKQDEGIRICLENKKIVTQSDNPWRYYVLHYFCASLVRMYSLNKQFDQALAMSKEMAHVSTYELPFPVINSQRRALYRVYAYRTFMYMMKGDLAAADECYRLCRYQDAFDPMTDLRLVEYLKKVGRYDEMLYYVQRVKNLLKMDGDTVSRVMVGLMEQEGDALYGMGKYKESAQSFDQLSDIVNTLNRQSSEEMMTSVRETLIQQREISRRNLVLAFVVFAFVILLIVMIFVYFYNRELNRKNNAMSKTLRELTFYREKLVNNHFVSSDKTGKIAIEHPRSTMRQRFDEMDSRIIQEELFRNPDFGRDDLMRMLRVDKNTLPGIISQYTGTNVAGYINSKRMEYAVSLMKDHPDYTLNAIAEACGMKTSATFIRNFKHIYGVTPSDFRTGLIKSLSNQK